MATVLMLSQMTPYLPCHDGFRVIPAHLIRCLSGRHEVHLVAWGTADETEWSRRYCASVEVLPTSAGASSRRLSGTPLEQMRQAARRGLERWQPEVVHLEGPALAPLAAAVPAALATLLSAHDALSLRHREFARFAPTRRERVLHRLRSWRARRFERRWFGRAGRVVVTSRPDLEALARSVPRERLAVVPNGVDLEHFRYAPQPGGQRLVFTGNMSWPPNEDAASYFAREVLPLVRQKAPDATFWVVGAEPSPRVQALAALPGVHVTGPVPDLREWIRSAAVYVSPLRFGAGVKNKVLEAMALGAPLVATPTSLTGTPLVDGRQLLIANSPAGLAVAVCRLLGDEALRLSLSLEARGHVEAEYSWSRVAERFERLWREAARP